MKKTTKKTEPKTRQSPTLEAFGIEKRGSRYIIRTKGKPTEIR